MSEYDPYVAAVLERVLPPALEAGDWARVLRDAQANERGPLVRLRETARRRRALLFAALCFLAALVTVPALAVSKGWWFLDFGGPKPITKVVVVKSGIAAERGWALTAYVSESQGLCVALTMERPSNVGAQGCGVPVRGAPRASEGKGPSHWLSYVYTGGNGLTPAFVFGPAAAAVKRVDVVFADGTTDALETIAAPAELGLPLRFFVAELPVDTKARALIARAASGATLERLRVPPPGLP